MEVFPFWAFFSYQTAHMRLGPRIRQRASTVTSRLTAMNSRKRRIALSPPAATIAGTTVGRFAARVSKDSDGPESAGTTSRESPSESMPPPVAINVTALCYTTYFTPLRRGQLAGGPTNRSKIQPPRPPREVRRPRGQPSVSVRAFSALPPPSAFGRGPATLPAPIASRRSSPPQRDNRFSNEKRRDIRPD